MRLYRSSQRPVGMLMVQTRGMCQSTSRYRPVWPRIQSVQVALNRENLGPKEGGGDVCQTMAYVRWARDWPLRTGAVSTHPGGITRRERSRARPGRTPADL